MPTIYGYTDIQGNLNIKGFGTTSTTNSLNIEDSNSNTLLYVSDSGRVSGGPLSYSFSFGGLSSFVDSDYFVIGSTIRGENTQLVINGGAYPQITFNNSIYGSDMYILSGAPGNHLEIGNTLGGGKFTYIGDRNIGVGFDGSYYSPAATVDIIGIDNTISNFAVKVQSASFSPLLVVRNDGNIGIGTASPEHKLQVSGTTSTTGFRMTNGASSGYILQSDSTGNATWVSAGSSSINFSNTNLTLTGTRLHNTNGNDLTISSDGNSLNQLVFAMQGTSSLTLGHVDYFAEFTDVDFHVASPGGSRRIEINATETVFNNNSLMVNFRVEGNTYSNLFFIDSSNDSINIGATQYSDYTYNLYIESERSVGLVTKKTTQDINNIGHFIDIQSQTNLAVNISDYKILIATGSNYNYGDIISISGRSKRSVGAYYEVTGASISNIGISIDTSGTSESIIGLNINAYSGTQFSGPTSSGGAKSLQTERGDVLFNSSSSDSDFKINGYSSANLFFADASMNRIGIGTGNPSYKLHVSGTISSTTGFNTNNLDGWNGTFSADGQIVTVTGGIITSVV